MGVLRLTAAAAAALVVLLICASAPMPADAQDFDFFYFVLQWPGSYCDTRQSCCYPTSGKPAADFGIHGLWPNNNDGSWPSNCDPDSQFDASQISDLRRTMEEQWPTLSCPTNDGLRFWEHEWEKHGTCAESLFDQHGYFKTALEFKQKVGLLKALTGAGIRPDGGFYSAARITSAIKQGTGVLAGIECNVDESRNAQLYQVYFCVDNTATELIDCPKLPRSKCSTKNIEFPAF